MGYRKHKVIAHRGASGKAPENTLAAMKLAGELGADMIETDIRTTEDGELIVMHDAEVDRTTDGSGPVSGMTLEQLRTLDAGSWFGPEFREEKVPTLEEALKEAKEAGCDLCIEIKEADPLRAIEKSREAGYADRIYLFDFDHPRLYRAKEAEPGIRALALGVSPRNLDSLDTSKCNVAGVSFRDVDDALVRFLHGLGMSVFTYTVDDPEDMHALIKMGVDAIITNYPSRALELLDLQLE